MKATKITQYTETVNSPGWKKKTEDLDEDDRKMTPVRQNQSDRIRKTEFSAKKKRNPSIKSTTPFKNSDVRALGSSPDLSKTRKMTGKTPSQTRPLTGKVLSMVDYFETSSVEKNGDKTKTCSQQGPAWDKKAPAIRTNAGT